MSSSLHGECLHQLEDNLQMPVFLHFLGSMGLNQKAKNKGLCYNQKTLKKEKIVEEKGAWVLQLIKIELIYGSFNPNGAGAQYVRPQKAISP